MVIYLRDHSLRDHPVVHALHVLLLRLLHGTFGHWKESISLEVDPCQLRCHCEGFSFDAVTLATLENLRSGFPLC